MEPTGLESLFVRPQNRQRNFARDFADALIANRSLQNFGSDVELSIASTLPDDLVPDISDERRAEVEQQQVDAQQSNRGGIIQGIGSALDFYDQYIDDPIQGVGLGAVAAATAPLNIAYNVGTGLGLLSERDLGSDSSFWTLTPRYFNNLVDNIQEVQQTGANTYIGPIGDLLQVFEQTYNETDTPRAVKGIVEILNPLDPVGWVTLKVGRVPLRAAASSFQKFHSGVLDIADGVIRTQTPRSALPDIGRGVIGLDGIVDIGAVPADILNDIQRSRESLGRVGGAILWALENNAVGRGALRLIAPKFLAGTEWEAAALQYARQKETIKSATNFTREYWKEFELVDDVGEYLRDDAGNVLTKQVFARTDKRFGRTDALFVLDENGAVTNTQFDQLDEISQIAYRTTTGKAGFFMQYLVDNVEDELVQQLLDRDQIRWIRGLHKQVDEIREFAYLHGVPEDILSVIPEDEVYFPRYVREDVFNVDDEGIRLLDLIRADNSTIFNRHNWARERRGTLLNNLNNGVIYHSPEDSVAILYKGILDYVNEVNFLQQISKYAKRNVSAEVSVLRNQMKHLYNIRRLFQTGFGRKTRPNLRFFDAGEREFDSGRVDEAIDELFSRYEVLETEIKQGKGNQVRRNAEGNLVPGDLYSPLREGETFVGRDEALQQFNQEMFQMLEDILQTEVPISPLLTIVNDMSDILSDGSLFFGLNREQQEIFRTFGTPEMQEIAAKMIAEYETPLRETRRRVTPDEVPPDVRYRRARDQYEATGRRLQGQERFEHPTTQSQRSTYAGVDIDDLDDNSQFELFTSDNKGAYGSRISNPTAEYPVPDSILMSDRTDNIRQLRQDYIAAAEQLFERNFLQRDTTTFADILESRVTDRAGELRNMLEARHALTAKRRKQIEALESLDKEIQIIDADPTPERLRRLPKMRRDLEQGIAQVIDGFRAEAGNLEGIQPRFEGFDARLGDIFRLFDRGYLQQVGSQAQFNNVETLGRRAQQIKQIISLERPQALRAIAEMEEMLDIHREIVGLRGVVDAADAQRVRPSDDLADQLRFTEDPDVLPTDEVHIRRGITEEDYVDSDGPRGARGSHRQRALELERQFREGVRRILHTYAGRGESASEIGRIVEMGNVDDLGDYVRGLRNRLQNTEGNIDEQVSQLDLVLQMERNIQVLRRQNTPESLREARLLERQFRRAAENALQDAPSDGVSFSGGDIFEALDQSFLASLGDDALTTDIDQLGDMATVIAQLRDTWGSASRVGKASRRSGGGSGAAQGDIFTTSSQEAQILLRRRIVDYWNTATNAPFPDKVRMIRGVMEKVFKSQERLEGLLSTDRVSLSGLRQLERQLIIENGDYDRLFALRPDRVPHPEYPHVQRYIKGAFSTKEARDGVERILTAPAGALRSFVGGVSAVSATFRALNAAFDLGIFGIHGFLMFAYDPRAWATSVSGSLNVLVDTGQYAKYLRENTSTLTEMIQQGWRLNTASVQDLAGVSNLGVDLAPRGGLVGATAGIFQRRSDEAVGRSARAREEAILERGVRPTERTLGHLKRHFEAFFNANRTMMSVEMYKNMRSTWLAAGGDLLDLADFTNKATGFYDTTSAGFGVQQQGLERAFLFFAPRYTRASLALVGNIFSGGIKGEEAFKAVSSMATIIPMYYTWMATMLGQEPKLDPRPISDGGDGGEFLSLNIGGQNISLASIWTAMARTAGQVFTTANEDPLLLVRPWEGTANPITRFFMNRTAPAVSLMRELINGESFLGRPLENNWDRLQLVAGSALPFWMEALVIGEGAESGLSSRLLAGGTEFFGGRQYPISVHERLYAERDKAAALEYGKGLSTPIEWGDLNELQQIEIRNNPRYRVAALEEAQRQHFRDDRVSEALDLYYELWNQRSADRVSAVHWGVQQVRPGGRDTLWLREHVLQANDTAYATAELLRSGVFDKVREQLTEQAASGSEILPAEDFALSQYMTMIVLNEDVYHDDGSYDYAMRRLLEERFVHDWGDQVFEYVQTVFEQRLATPDNRYPDVLGEWLRGRRLFDFYWNEPIEAVINKSQFPDSLRQRLETYYRSTRTDRSIQEEADTELREARNQIERIRRLFREKHPIIDIYMHRWYGTNLAHPDNQWEGASLFYRYNTDIDFPYPRYSYVPTQ